MPKLSSIQNFGEQFLSVIQNLKKERTEKEQFEKDMRFKHRQMNLLNSRFLAEQDRLKTQFEATHGLNKEKEATDILQFNQTLDYNKEVEAQNIIEGEADRKLRERGQNITAGYYKQLADQNAENLKFKYADLDFKKTVVAMSGDEEIFADKKASELIGKINTSLVAGDDAGLTGSMKQLMNYTKLEEESLAMGQALDSGLNVEESIKKVNEFMKKNGVSKLTPTQEIYMRLYGKGYSKMQPSLMQKIGNFVPLIAPSYKNPASE